MMHSRKPKFRLWFLSLCLIGLFIIAGFLLYDSLTSPGENRDVISKTDDHKSTPIPWFARKWTDAIQHSNPLQRRQILADALKSRQSSSSTDRQSPDELYFQDRALELIDFALNYTDSEDFIARYVAGHPQNRMLYHLVIGMVGEAQMPQLYDMLNDESYASHWHNISRVIGMVSQDPASADALWDYFQRNDSRFFSAAQASLSGKTYSLALIGKIGSDKYFQTLRQAATLEGAENLANQWIDEPEVLDVSSRQSTLNKIRSYALRGLIYSQDPENIRYVTQLYQQELAYCQANNTHTKLLSSLTDCMGYQDYIDENSLHLLFLELSVTPPVRESLASHIKKYIWTPK